MMDESNREKSRLTGALKREKQQLDFKLQSAKDEIEDLKSGRDRKSKEKMAEIRSLRGIRTLSENLTNFFVCTFQ